VRDNLTAIVASAQKKNARVLLVGQRIPPNYGAYALQFHQVFAEVAKARKRRW
jgi:acyl-CoA thioesterase-1